MEFLILPKTNEAREKIILRVLRILFLKLFGRIENSKNCFRDLLTFMLYMPQMLRIPRGINVIANHIISEHLWVLDIGEVSNQIISVPLREVTKISQKRGKTHLRNCKPFWMKTRVQTNVVFFIDTAFAPFLQKMLIPYTCHYQAWQIRI